MKKIMILPAVILFLALTAGVNAEYVLDPQYANQGKVGSTTKPWGEINTKDLNITGAINSYVTPYGAQIKPTPVLVNSYTQLTALGGTSVYVVDLSLGNEFRIDTQAIYESIDAAAGLTNFKAGLSGLTVVAAEPDATNNHAMFDLVKWDSSVTGITLWADHTSGITPEFNVLASYHSAQSGTSLWACASSVSDVPLDKQYDRTRYQLCYDSGASIIPVFNQVSGTKE